MSSFPQTIPLPVFLDGRLLRHDKDQPTLQHRQRLAVLVDVIPITLFINLYLLSFGWRVLRLRPLADLLWQAELLAL